MKKLYKLTILVCLLFIYGCANPTLDNNNNNNNNNDNNNPINNSTTYIITQYGKWTVVRANNLSEIFFNPNPSAEDNGYQYAALHTNSSYVRLNYGPESAWGTSIVLFPSFWKKEKNTSKYYQGTPIIFSTQPDFNAGSLIILFQGLNQGLLINGSLTISPPKNNEIKANVAITSQHTDNFEIDIINHPFEAFKPVFLSSMRISENYWDTKKAFIDGQSYEIPFENFILNPPVNGNKFGLEGGLSQWQIENQNVPAISTTIILDNPMNIQGFVTASDNPNDDNVGFWSATDNILDAWEYDIIISEHVELPESSPLRRDIIYYVPTKNNSAWR